MPSSEALSLLMASANLYSVLPGRSSCRDLTTCRRAVRRAEGDGWTLPKLSSTKNAASSNAGSVTLTRLRLAALVAFAAQAAKGFYPGNGSSAAFWRVCFLARVGVLVGICRFMVTRRL